VSPPAALKKGAVGGRRRRAQAARRRAHEFSYRASAVTLITFGASLVGIALQWAAPADVLTASKGSVGAMVGFVTFLLALVLGLLVFPALFEALFARDAEAKRAGAMLLTFGLPR
jgi:hypothetical protein